MKKIILMVTVLLLALSASAQKVGVIGGLTSTQLSLKDVDESSFSGYHMGLTFKQPLLLGLSIQPSLVYNVKGSNFDSVSLSSLGSVITSGVSSISLPDFKTKMKYVELPVQVQWGIDLLVARPYVFAEPFIGYALSGDYSYTLLSSAVSGDIDMDDLDSRLEYGFSLGFGIDVLDKVQVSLKHFWNYEDLNIKSISEYGGAIGADVKDRRSFDGMAVSVAIFF